LFWKEAQQTRQGKKALVLSGGGRFEGTGKGRVHLNPAHSEACFGKRKSSPFNVLRGTRGKKVSLVLLIEKEQKIPNNADPGIRKIKTISDE